MTKSTFSLLFLTLSVIGLSLWPAPTPAQAQAPDTAPSVSRGRALWGENCEPCHGLSGQGDGPTAQSLPGPPPDFSDPTVARQLVPADNVTVITEGRMENFMPPWREQLDQGEIWDTAAYIWRLGTTPEAIARGESLYSEQCSACHGESGAGDGPEAEGDLLDFTAVALMAQRSQADLQANFVAAEAHADLETLAEAEVWATLDYIRTFSFMMPQRNGVLSGQVINATTGTPVGNIEVTLRLFDSETEVESVTTQADSTGTYTFEQLATEHRLQYVVEGIYQDIRYASQEAAIFVPDSNETTLDLPVYETTTSAEAVHLSRMNNLVAFDGETVQIVQIFVLSNYAPATYIGQEGQDGTTFEFSLPAAAENVTFENDFGDRFIEQGDGFADTEPVVPGEDSHFIVAMYSLPYEGDSLTVEIPLADAVPSLNVLMQAVGAEFNSEQLELAESREGHGDRFEIFSGRDFEAGETLRFELTNLDSLELASGFNTPVAGTTAPTVDQNFLRWLLTGVGGLLLIGVVLLYPYWRQRRNESVQSVPAAPAPADDDPRRQKLLLTLARLDQMFAAGDIDEAVYHQTRAKYKAELAELMGDG